ncbi:MAG: ABC transporter permease [Candidatus Aenigmatarchaeota archaeon]
MIDFALKDLKGHRVRTILTGLGILIAITAIVSLGSISAGINEMVTSTTSKVGSDTIFIMKTFDMSSMSGPPTSWQISDISQEDVEAIKSISGIKRAVPVLSKSMGGIMEVDAIDIDNLDIFGADDLTFKEGSMPGNDDQGAALGYTAAKILGVSSGDYITLNKKEVEVMGVVEEGYGSYDLVILLPYKYGEEIYDAEGEATQVMVEPQDVSLVDEIKNTVKDEFDGLDAMTMEDALSMSKQMTQTLDIMTLGIGFIASLVAAIGIIITMYTSVLERRRQLGIMKAVGALRRTIMKQILEEALLISLVSSMIGLGISFVFVDLINNVLLGGTKIATITPLLGIGAVAYGVMITIISSLYPAWVAVKIDPIEAIRKG